MNSNLQLVTQENFGTVQCDFYKQDDQVWMTREQIGAALDYVDPQKAIDNIHARHADRLSKFSVTLKLRATDGKDYDTVVYSPKGVYEICRWSRQPKANAFYDWVYEVLEKLRTKQATLIESVQLMQLLAQMTQGQLSNTQITGRLVGLIESHDARIEVLERALAKGVANHDPLTGNLGNSFITQPTLAILSIDQPSKILAAIYKWANHNQTSFYGRNNSSDFDLWGRWDKGNWQYLSFYPDKIRYLIDLYGGEPNQVLHTWRDRGWLETNNEKNRFTKTVRVGHPGNAVRLISIKRYALQKVTRAASSLTGRL